ncbi:MAG: DUF1996 domain-containing protein [Acidimicrobiales bacterium]
MRRTLLAAIAVPIMVAVAVPAAASAAAPRLPRANFVSTCLYSHSAPDDPIVHPGAPGASHLHDFFGNMTTGAGSTLESLLAGQTDCRRPLDTAAYWTPALYDAGQVVEPRAVLAYYLTKGKDPATIRPFPTGLRVVASAGRDRVEWACIGRDGDRVMSTTGAPGCRAGEELVVRIFFPDCWDGISLDSADHRSHMAVSTRGACPAGHPVPVPLLRLGFRYPGTNGGADVTLASGAQATAHADFFNGWDQAELQRLVRSCLNAGVQCQRGG